MDSISPDTPQRQCTKCEKFFPVTSQFFPVDRSRKDGFHLYCKTCKRAHDTEYMKQYRQTEKNKAYCKAHSAEYYREHRDELKEWNKQYHELHKEERNQQKREYRKSHPDLIREQEKRKREKYKDEIRERKKRWQQGTVYKEYQKHYQKDNAENIRDWRKQYYNAHAENWRERQRWYGKTAQGRMVDKAHKHKRRAQKKASGGSYTAQQLQEQMHRQKSKCYYCKKKLGKIYHADHIVPLARGGTNDIHNIVLTCPTCNMQKNAKLPHEWFEGGRLL